MNGKTGVNLPMKKNYRHLHHHPYTNEATEKYDL